MDDDMMGGPDLPRGVSSHRGVWQGETLEMEHQQEAFRNEKRNIAAAVDIKQFQNNVVGEGYQAKHVIRQPSANQAPKMVVRDMTGAKKSGKGAEDSISIDRDEFLKNAGLREFRREIENILSS